MNEGSKQFFVGQLDPARIMSFEFNEDGFSLQLRETVSGDAAGKISLSASENGLVPVLRTQHGVNMVSAEALDTIALKQVIADGDWSRSIDEFLKLKHTIRRTDKPFVCPVAINHDRSGRLVSSTERKRRECSGSLARQKNGFDTKLAIRNPPERVKR